MLAFTWYLLVISPLRRLPSLGTRPQGTTTSQGGRRLPYTDKPLTCVDCGAEFTFSAEDQEYYATRGFQNEPKRCPTCRRAPPAGREGGGGPGRMSLCLLSFGKASRKATS